MVSDATTSAQIMGPPMFEPGIAVIIEFVETGRRMAIEDHSLWHIRTDVACDSVTKTRMSAVLPAP